VFNSFEFLDLNWHVLLIIGTCILESTYCSSLHLKFVRLYRKAQSCFWKRSILTYLTKYSVLLKLLYLCSIKLSCDSRFQRAFTACVCVFKEITLVGSNQRNYFENANACSKRTLKTTVTIQLKVTIFDYIVNC